MKPISDFFPRLLPYLPGCSEPLAAQAVLDAAIEFCDKTLVVRHTLDPMVTVVEGGVYDLDIPAQQEVARILAIDVGGTRLQSVPDEYSLAATTTASKPTAFYTSRNDAEFYLRLFPLPDAVYDMTVQVALRPTRTATQLDDELLTRWVDAVTCAARARIMLVPGQPFSDPSGALYYSGMAAKYANSARIESSSGRLRGSMAVTQRPFA